MFGEKHDLIHELPELREQIHLLKTTDNHFARLYDEYHEVEHKVRRIEEGLETVSDDYLEEQKKLRLNLKDRLFGMLQQA